MKYRRPMATARLVRPEEISIKGEVEYILMRAAARDVRVVSLPPLLFFSALLGVPCFLMWREYGQQRLNQELLSAINHDDTPSALFALEHGADANAHFEKHIPARQRIWSLVRWHCWAPPTFTTPLL